MTRWMQGTMAVFWKDLRLEFRSRHALYLLLLFVVGTALIILFALGQTPLNPRMQSALLWTVILFGASLGLGRSFVSEEEQGTRLLLLLHVPPLAVYAGKLLFNLVLTLILNLVAFLAFFLVVGLSVAQPGLMALTLALSAVGLAGAHTLLAAILARTGERGPLLPVLGFPTLVPLLLSAISATGHALTGASISPALNDLAALAGYAGAVITASFLLFDHVWKD